MRPPRSDRQTPSGDAPRAWSQGAQDLAAVLWPGFLAACAGTLLFFAFFDPILFRDAQPDLRWLGNRLAGYALGFFFFWAIASFASALTLFLLRTSQEPRRPPHRGES